MKYEYTGSQYLLHGDIGNGNTWLTITADAAATLTLNTWHMVTYVVNGSSGYSIYLDGSPLVSNAAYTYAGTPQFMQSSATMLIGDTTGSRCRSRRWSGRSTRPTSSAPRYGTAQVSSLYQGQVQSSGQLPAATPLTVAAGATLDLNSQSQAAASLAGSGVVTNSGTAGVTLTLAPAAGTSATFSGAIRDNGPEIPSAL